MRILVVAALSIWILFPGPVAWGQNLVVNPDFDSDVSGWSTSATASIEWDPLDAEGDPASGSALVTNRSTTALDATGAWQCLDFIEAEAFYRLAAEVLVPSGQSETGYAELLVQWFDTPGCGGGQLGLNTTPGVSTSTPDAWYLDAGVVEAPAATQSARLRLSVLKIEDSGSLEAHFDNVEFVELVFFDGFESGDTTAWSAVVP